VSRRAGWSAGAFFLPCGAGETITQPGAGSPAARVLLVTAAGTEVRFRRFSDDLQH
jgi:hypothetical protein